MFLLLLLPLINYKRRPRERSTRQPMSVRLRLTSEIKVIIHKHFTNGFIHQITLLQPPIPISHTCFCCPPTHTHLHTYTCAHTHIHAHTRRQTHTQTNSRTYTRMHARANTHTHHTHTHTHHTHSRKPIDTITLSHTNTVFSKLFLATHLHGNVIKSLVVTHNRL